MNELKVKMTQIKFQNEQLLQERDSGKTYTKNKLAEYKMFIDSYNDRHTNDAFNTKNNLRLIFKFLCEYKVKFLILLPSTLIS